MRLSVLRLVPPCLVWPRCAPLRLARPLALLPYLSLALWLSACGEREAAAPGAGPPEGQDTPAGAIHFIDAAAESGIAFRHVAGRSAHKPMPEIMGSGVAVADFDRNGAPDLLLVNSGALQPGGLRAAERPAVARNHLYLNDGGGRFREVGESWDLPSRGYGMGVAVGDVDNDGWTDVLLTHLDGELLLLRNRQGAGFEEIGSAAGLQGDGLWATSAGFFDQDNDGWLDLFVLRYLDLHRQDPVSTQSFRNGLLIYPTPLLFQALPDRYWANRGRDGSGSWLGYAEAGQALGISQSPGKGLALAIGDLDLDGHAEVYVANDTDANQLWTRNASGGMYDIAQLAGSAFDAQGREEGSMGADFSDFDDNGLPDIAVSNFQLEVTSMYRQQPALLFSESADAVGVGQSSRQRLGFGLDFFDIDNDGDEDLLVANGHIEDNIHLNSDSVSFPQQNSLYLNLASRAGGAFSDISDSAGPALQQREVSRGLATADFDGDGRLDFVVSNNEGPAQLAYNRSQPVGNYVILWLEGVQSNRSAIGARVVAQVGQRSIQRQVMGAQSYLSVSDLRLHFGLGQADAIDRLSIHWPGAEVQQLGPLQAGAHYHIRQGQPPRRFQPGAGQIAP